VFLILLSQSSVCCPNHCMSLHSPLTITQQYLRFYYVPTISKSHLTLDYMHANWPVFRSILDQLIITIPHIRDHTDLEHMIQDFSVVWQAVFTAIPQLTAQCHLLTFPPSLVNLWNSKIITNSTIKDQDSICLISFTNFSPVFSLPNWLNYEILNEPPFLAHYTRMQTYFGKLPGTSQPLHDLFLPYLTIVCRSSILQIEPNS
jgi:hypothetical protein